MEQRVGLRTMEESRRSGVQIPAGPPQFYGMHAIFYTTDAGNILSTEFTVEVAEVIRIGTVEEIESIIQKVNHGPIELTHKESKD